jgi:hypothetical protein
MSRRDHGATITLSELHELRAALDAIPGRSADELADELENLTVYGQSTDTLDSFHRELGL